MMFDLKTPPNTRIMYPNQFMGRPFNRNLAPALYLTWGQKTATLIASREDGNGNHPMVMFPDMDKQELQRVIDELQKVCNSLEGADSDGRNVQEMVLDKNPFHR